ncbi:hypothetical protein B9Z19DRAFT_1122614 [Tuber borchii]|uniref:Uncharacterized protein n=1 Tax=Tuber borchii TaxID=42251 RepID=A0A2T7A024_TUBBO|nr:hypothetical protein B9Z19DRAFT_1122614 [Tuber borchii]
MPTSGEDHTSEYRLTLGEMEGDLDMVKPVEWLLPNAEGYDEGEEDKEDQYVDFIDLCESDEEDGNVLEESDEIYGEERITKRSSRRGSKWTTRATMTMMTTTMKMGSENNLVTVLVRRASWDLDHPDSAPSTRGLYSDAAENHFWASTQEIGERLLGRVMTAPDVFTSAEDREMDR